MDPITAYLVTALIGVVIQGAVSLARQAFAPKPEAAQQKQIRGLRGQYTTGGTVPMTIVLGTYGIAGQLEYSNVWGNDGETPNAYLADVISLADYPITEVSAVWLDSKSVTLSGSGSLSRGYPFTEFEIGSKDYAWYRFYEGDQSSADTYLVSKFGGDSKRPWESDMVGEGISYAIQTARINEKLFTDFPRYMYQVEGAPVFDPRESTTAGGSGSQVWGTFATYAFSDNPVVLIYNILRGLSDAGGNFIWGGHATAYQLPYAEWAAAMDLCDTTVDLKGGGSEKRYRAGIEISLNERPADIIRELLVACNARMAFERGQYHILVDVPDEADASFTDADLLIEEAIDFSQFPNLDEAVNGVSATFLAPQRAWEERETKPYYRDNLATEDGQINRDSLRLRCVFSGSQAQRIIKAVVQEGRRFKKAVVCLPPEFGQYRPLQVLAWTSSEFQYSSKLWLIISRTEDEWGRIWFALHEIDPSDFDWDEETDETTLTFADTDESPVPSQAADGFDAAPTVFLDNDGTSRRPGIMVSFAPDLDDVRAVRVTVTLAGSAVNVYDNETTYDPDAVDDITLPKEFLPATDYEVTGQYLPFDGSGRTTTPSDPVSVTTDDIRLGALDIYEGSIIADLPQSLIDWQEWAGAGLRDLIDELREIARLARDQDLANYRDVQTLNRRLVSTFESSRAEFNESILAATGPESAIVLQLTELQAQVDDDIALAVSGLTTQIGDVNGSVQSLAEAFTALTASSVSGDVATTNFRMSAVSGPSGYSRIGAQTRYGGTGSWRGASWYLDTPSNAALPTRFVVNAQQFVIVSAGFEAVPFVFESGEAKMTAARIGTIKAGKLQNASGSSYFDLTNNKLRIST